jgi:hypothetical protein
MSVYLLGWTKVLILINSLSSNDFNKGEYKQGPADLHRMASVHESKVRNHNTPDNMKEAILDFMFILNKCWFNYFA